MGCVFHFYRVNEIDAGSIVIRSKREAKISFSGSLYYCLSIFGDRNYDDPLGA
jgi:hypothetical protein